jgi:hypothetical protein
MTKNRTFIITIPLLVILAALLFYQYVYLNVQADIASLKERQAMKTATLEKYISLLAEKPHLEEKLPELRDLWEEQDSKLIEGQTLSVAAASLQDTIKNIILSSRGTITSERVGKPEDEGNFKKIIVSIDALLPDVRSLSDVLYSIETNIPYMTVHELDVRIRNYRDPRELIVKFQVSALTKGT